MLIQFSISCDYSILEFHDGRKDTYIHHQWPNASTEIFPYSEYISEEPPYRDAMKPYVHRLRGLMTDWSTSYANSTVPVLVQLPDELAFTLGIMGVTPYMHLVYELNTGFMAFGSNQDDAQRNASEPGRINNSASRRPSRLGATRSSKNVVIPFFDFSNVHRDKDMGEPFSMMVDDPEYKKELSEILAPHIKHYLRHSFISTVNNVYETIFEDYLYEESNNAFKERPLLKYDEKRSESVHVSDNDVYMWYFVITRMPELVNSIYESKATIRNRINKMLQYIRIELDQKPLNDDD